MPSRSASVVALASLMMLSTSCAVVDSAQRTQWPSSTEGTTYSLPRGFMRFELKQQGIDLFVTYEGRTIEPDFETAPIALDYCPSIFGADYLKFELTSKGLLDRVEVKTEDKLDEVIVELAKSAARVLAPIPAPMGLVEPESDVVRTVYSFRLDPFDAQSVRRANQKIARFAELHLQNLGRRYRQLEAKERRIKRNPMATTGVVQTLKTLREDLRALGRLIEWTPAGGGSWVWKARDPGCTSLAATPLACTPIRIEPVTHGVLARRVAAGSPTRLVAPRVGFFRRQARGLWSRTPVDAELDLIGIEGLPTGVARATLPNRGEALLIEIRRSAFVEKKTIIDFEDGMLKMHEVTKPSEALAFVEIPIEIAKAVLQAPAQIFQFRLNQTSAEKELEQEKKALLDAEQALDEARKALLPSSDDDMDGLE